MVQLATILTVSSLLVLSSAHQKKKQAESLIKVPGREVPAIKPRSLAERQTCSGTCAECFGSGYTTCPDSSIFCYLPGDSSYGLDSCPGSGTDSTETYSAPDPSSTGSSGASDFCYDTGATCVSCFGPGYVDCGDGVNCYNPDGQ